MYKKAVDLTGPFSLSDAERMHLGAAPAIIKILRMLMYLIFMYQIYAVLHILKSALLTSVRPLMSLQMR